MNMRFAKYEGLGNDFIVVDTHPVLSTAQVRFLCDRHLGVGADGVLFVGVRDGRPSMSVVNADGSRPEMCGNGLRCVAQHLRRSGLVDHDGFDVDTDAGAHRCRVVQGDVEVEMVVPSLVPADVPVVADRPLVDAPFDVNGENIRVTAVSMGNPHAVTFDDVGDRRFELGPRIEVHPRFPGRVNVGFASIREDSSGSYTKLDVWERGVGWTRACGTGACAAAVAAVETGRAERGVPIVVELPGGRLEITVRGASDRVLMRGPARHVFDGGIELEVAAR